MERICGIDFGVRTYACVSDGAEFFVHGARNLESAAVAMHDLCNHINHNFDVAVIEGIKGSDTVARNIDWFKRSMKRRFHRVRVVRADHDFPSTKLCRVCGTVVPKFIEKMFVCQCGIEEDRDYHAAVNLRFWYEQKKGLL